MFCHNFSLGKYRNILESLSFGLIFCILPDMFFSIFPVLLVQCFNHEIHVLKDIFLVMAAKNIHTNLLLFTYTYVYYIK